MTQYWTFEGLVHDPPRRCAQDLLFWHCAHRDQETSGHRNKDFGDIALRQIVENAILALAALRTETNKGRKTRFVTIMACIDVTKAAFFIKISENTKMFRKKHLLSCKIKKKRHVENRALEH